VTELENSSQEGTRDPRVADALDIGNARHPQYRCEGALSKMSRAFPVPMGGYVQKRVPRSWWTSISKLSEKEEADPGSCPVLVIE